MKKMGTKRIVELTRALVAVMLALACVALLAGCGGGGTSDGSTGGSTGGSDAPAEATGPAQEAIDYWNGDWFGWWIWENGTGEAADLSGGYWDCQAEFSTGADGKGHVVIWDQDWSKDDGIAEVDYTISGAGGPLGTLTSDSGWFINSADKVSSGDWVIDAAAQGAEDFIVIRGTYVSDSDPATSFTYKIYLRPWGASWEDAPVEAPDNLDWYNSAKGGEMPDVIGS